MSVKKLLLALTLPAATALWLAPPAPPAAYAAPSGQELRKLDQGLGLHAKKAKHAKGKKAKKGKKGKKGRKHGKKKV